MMNVSYKQQRKNINERWKFFNLLTILHSHHQSHQSHLVPVYHIVDVDVRDGSEGPVLKHSVRDSTAPG